MAQTAALPTLTAAEVVGLGRIAHEGWLGQARSTPSPPPTVTTRRSIAPWSQRFVTLGRADCDFVGKESVKRVHLARVLAVEATVMCSMKPTRTSIARNRKMSRGLREQARPRGAWCGAIHDRSVAMAADDLIVC